MKYFQMRTFLQACTYRYYACYMINFIALVMILMIYHNLLTYQPSKNGLARSIARKVLFYCIPARSCGIL